MMTVFMPGKWYLYFLSKIIQGKILYFILTLSEKQNVAKKFPKFYQEILTRWRKYLSSPPKVLSAVASQLIWYNEYVKIDNNAIYECCFSQKKP